MKHRNTPIQFVLARKSSAIEAADTRQEENTVYLEGILVPENRKR